MKHEGEVRDPKKSSRRGTCCWPLFFPILWDLVLESVLFMQLLWQYVRGVPRSDAAPLSLARELKQLSDVKSFEPIRIGSLQLRNRVSE